ncbi:MAG: Flp pilus assembly complex ATPase component TadA [Oscillospiraceae bacterium]|nr:Flp pilus assembly complex ATPase component TadA [Oscillospiraceae bacterium]
MKCAWQAYLNLLPHWVRQDVDLYGKEALQELHMRIGLQPEICLGSKTQRIHRNITKDDISFVINAASEYSPWAARTLAKGYLTAQGGHRIGVCGVATVADGAMRGITQATSLCLRVARDIEGISPRASDVTDSLLIIGPPGSGKTTLLRDIIRTKSNAEQGNISVVDEREELFPLYKGQSCFPAGEHTDILSGCSKAEGIEAVLRSMNPRWIAVDEITEKSDCDALLQAGWCGVNLMATAHAGSLQDFLTRPIYKPLVACKIFTTVLVLQRDKSWKKERLYL